MPRGCLGVVLGSEPDRVGGAGAVGAPGRAVRTADADTPARRSRGDDRGEPGGQGDEAGRGDVRGRGQHRGRWTCCAPAVWTGCFDGIYAPSTLGSFLRSFTHGHVRQLQAASRRFTANLIAHAGLIAPGEPIVYLDIDSKVKQVYGPAKQGASFGYTKVRGLHFQIVTASTPSLAPGGDRDAAAQGLGRLRQGRRLADRRGDPRAARGRDHRDDPGARRLGVLLREARQGDPGRRGAVLDHGGQHDADPHRRSVRSPRPPGNRSSTATRSGTRTSTAGSPKRRSPRSRTPRSPRKPRICRSPRAADRAAGAGA